jgi:hypothetical protein
MQCPCIYAGVIGVPGHARYSGVAHVTKGPHSRRWQHGLVHLGWVRMLSASGEVHSEVWCAAGRKAASSGTTWATVTHAGRLTTERRKRVAPRLSRRSAAHVSSLRCPAKRDGARQQCLADRRCGTRSDRQSCDRCGTPGLPIPLKMFGPKMMRNAMLGTPCPAGSPTPEARAQTCQSRRMPIRSVAAAWPSAARSRHVHHRVQHHRKVAL